MQYQRLQDKWNQAYENIERARSPRRIRYWCRLADRIAAKKPSKQVQAEIAQLDRDLAFIKDH